MFVDQIFPSSFQKNMFLQKIKDYHEETEHPIYVKMKHTKPFGSKEEYTLLKTIDTMLTDYDKSLVSKFIPQKTKKTMMIEINRREYRKTLTQIAFIEEAISQIQTYDPFYFCMDELHLADSLMTILVIDLQRFKEVLDF